MRGEMKTDSDSTNRLTGKVHSISLNGIVSQSAHIQCYEITTVLGLEGMHLSENIRF